MLGSKTTQELLAAEIIYLSYEIMRNLKVLNGLKFTLYIGHFKIIQAVCLHLGIWDSFTQNKVLETLYHFFVFKSNIFILGWKE